MKKNILIIPSNANPINIVDLSGNVIQKKEHFIFLLNTSDKTYSTNDIYEIKDPSEDQAFKVLFNGTN